MQTGVLRVLRATAASWWRHKELRRTGQTGQALQLERQTVLRDLGYLKQAAPLPNAHVICGEGGTFLHLGWTTVSTFAPIERFPLAALMVARGTTFIDIRPVTDVIACPFLFLLSGRASGARPALHPCGVLCLPLIAGSLPKAIRHWKCGPATTSRK